MGKQKLGKYYLNKEKIIADFGSMQECINQYGLNWKKACYGVDNLECFNDLPKKYILERKTTPKIYSEVKAKFVKSKSEATHILKDYKGGIVCKRI